MLAELGVSREPGQKIFLFFFLSGLNGTIVEQGSTFSAGEKQLFCLARAVLSPCKIVLIDEVTILINVCFLLLVSREMRAI